MKIENLKKRFRFNVHVSPRFFAVKRFDVLILESCFLTVTAAISKWDSIECVVFFLRICSALPPLKQWLNRKSRKQVGYAMHIWWQRNRQPNFVQQAQKVPLFMPRMLSTHTFSDKSDVCFASVDVMFTLFGWFSKRALKTRKKTHARTHLIPSTPNKLYFLPCIDKHGIWNRIHTKRSICIHQLYRTHYQFTCVCTIMEMYTDPNRTKTLFNLSDICCW